MNLRYTRAHAPGAKQPGVVSMAQTAWRLRKLGLNAGTAVTIVSTLLQCKLRPAQSWKKVSLQPIVNFAFFNKLYKRHRPDFATFHTNHVAHYQHRFLRAMKPELFDGPTDPNEIKCYGDAIRYGYLTADLLLQRFQRLCQEDPSLVLCVASSMGQKPFVPERYGRIAPATCRVKDIDRLVDLVGVRGRCEFYSTMAPQWNLRIPDAALRQNVIEHLHSARYLPVDKAMYCTTVSDDTIVLTPLSHHGLNAETLCSFPTLPGAPKLPFADLVLRADPTAKSGCHDPIGMLAFFGTPVRRGHKLGDVNNLDIAPTLLSFLGLPVPEYMKGAVLAESFRTAPALKAAAAR